MCFIYLSNIEMYSHNYIRIKLTLREQFRREYVKKNLDTIVGFEGTNFEIYKLRALIKTHFNYY